MPHPVAPRARTSGQISQCVLKHCVPIDAGFRGWSIVAVSLPRSRSRLLTQRLRACDSVAVRTPAIALICGAALILSACTSSGPQEGTAQSNTPSPSNPGIPVVVPEPTGTVPFPSPGAEYGPMTPGPSQTSYGPSQGPAPAEQATQVPPPPPIPSGPSSSPGGMPQAGSCNVSVTSGPSATSVAVGIAYSGEPTALWLVVQSSRGEQSGPVEVVPGMNERVIRGVDAGSTSATVFPLPYGPSGPPLCSSS